MLTTNNCMELKAVVRVLDELTILDCFKDLTHVEINSDSAYVVNAINQKWLQNWKRNNWKTTDGGNVKNCELWKSLDNILEMYKKDKIKITFTKVKGHSGNTFNEMVDKLAKREVENLKL